MTRTVVSAALAWLGGFVVLLAMFLIATENRPVERGLWYVFAAMGAVPVAAFWALLGVMRTVQEECRALRRDIDRIHHLILTREPTSESKEDKSTSFRE
jgi:hypothetical protein